MDFMALQNFDSSWQNWKTRHESTMSWLPNIQFYVYTILQSATQIENRVGAFLELKWTSQMLWLQSIACKGNSIICQFPQSLPAKSCLTQAWAGRNHVKELPVASLSSMWVGPSVFSQQGSSVACCDNLSLQDPDLLSTAVSCEKATTYYFLDTLKLLSTGVSNRSISQPIYE